MVESACACMRMYCRSAPSLICWRGAGKEEPAGAGADLAGVAAAERVLARPPSAAAAAAGERRAVAAAAPAAAERVWALCAAAADAGQPADDRQPAGADEGARLAAPRAPGCAQLCSHRWAVTLVAQGAVCSQLHLAHSPLLLPARPVCSKRDVWHGTNPALGVHASSAAVLPSPLDACVFVARRPRAFLAARAGLAAGKQRRGCGGGAAVRRHLGQRAKRAARAAPQPFEPRQHKWRVTTLWFSCPFQVAL